MVLSLGLIQHFEFEEMYEFVNRRLTLSKFAIFTFPQHGFDAGVESANIGEIGHFEHSGFAVLNFLQKNFQLLHDPILTKNGSFGVNYVVTLI